MSGRRIDCGFVQLVDATPLIIAKEMGFAAEEGIDLVLHREKAWSALRDKLALGRYDAAHMLSPVPIAMSMGLGGMALPLDALTVLSINGNVIGASSELAEKMSRDGDYGRFADARRVGERLIACAERPLRIGVPFPFSMHAELVFYWLGALGLRTPQDLDVRTIPPPHMADAIDAGEIEAFCVGEPWGSIAVDRSVAELILPGRAIWAFSPEKVLAVRQGWPEREVEASAALMRAVWRAARWLSDGTHDLSVPEIICGPNYLDVAADVADRALQGRLLVTRDREEHRVPRFVEFFDGAATFPWRSQAVWIATRLAERTGLDRREAAKVARQCFRPDLYRANLAALGASMPRASEKVEGALTERTPVASSKGDMFLGPDEFFDLEPFDPDAVT